MKKLTILLSVLFIALTSVRAADVAQIGDTKYESLPLAIAAAPSGTQTTIELLGDVNEGPGIFLTANAGKDLVIDFNEKTYDVKGLVGSTGTENQAWHLEKGNKVHLKNGTLTAADAKFIIQNYCELTLTNMTITGTANCAYVVSNNCGECNILGTTSITAAEGKYAFDVCTAAAYPDGVIVNVNTTGKITGKIEYGTWGAVSEPKSSLAIENGTFENGEIVVDEAFAAAAPKIEIKGGTFNYAVPEEFIAGDAELGGLELSVDPTKWEMQLELVNGKASADKAFEVTLTNIAAYSAKIEGEKKDNFSWNERRELVKFNATAAGTYKATLVFSAKGVADVRVPLEITVKAPELSVSPDKWVVENLLIKNREAKAEQAFSILGSNLQGDVETRIQGGSTNGFSWDGTKVTFKSSETGEFYDTLLVSTQGVETVKVPLFVNVSRPVITAEDVDFEHVSLVNAANGIEKEAIVTVSPADDWSFTVGGTNKAAFENTEKKDGKLVVKLQTNTIGIYSATITIKAADALDKVINLSAVVDVPEAVLEVIPSEWKETVKLENGVAKAEHQISANAVFAFSKPEGRLLKGNAGFVWDGDNFKVTFSATEEATYQDTLIVSVLGATGKIEKKVALEIKVEKGGDTPTPEVHVTGVTLNKTAEELAIGGTLQLIATIEPSDATEKAVTWESSDPTVATVSATGLVTAVKAGSTTITVTTKDQGKTATCAITVKEEVVPPTPGGDAFTLVTNVSALSAGMELIIVSTKNNVAAGQWNSKNKYLATANVTIENNSIVLAENSTATIFTLDGNSGAWTLANPEGQKLSATQNDLAWDNENNKWSITISNSNGDAVIKNNAKGTFIQYNSSSPRFKTYSTTQVSPQIYARTATPPATVDVTGVTLNKQTASIEAGKSETLTATVAPENATNKKVTWSSSNEAVATVADGVVKAKAEGKATITVKTEQGGFEDKCEVTVTESTGVRVTGVELDKDSYEIMEGLTVTLKATVKPADATNKDVTWSSSDETVATVENGLVTTLKPGTVTITVKTVDGDFTATCVITVNRESPPLPGEVVFTKVTADQADWSGQYLLVYEKSATEALVFNGKDAGEGAGCVAATISNGAITLEDYAKYCIYVEKMNGGYSLKIGDNYIGGKDDNNGIVFAAEPILNTIKQYSADSLEIASNNVYMRFNKGAKDMRFRYFKASTYFRQEGVFLYKADQEITPQPTDTPDTISVAEAIRVCSEEKVHYVMGIVGEIQTTDDKLAQYHNLDFMLADVDDPSKQIKCYCLWWQKMNGEFNGGEIATGDTILVYGQTTIYTDKDKNKINEIINGYVVEILGKGDGTGPVGPTPHGDPLDIDYAEAAYVVDEEGPFWYLFGGKYPQDEAQEYLDYPIIELYIANEDDKHLAGTYDLYGGYLYTSDNDSVEFVAGSIYVACIEAGNELYAPYYTIVATLYDEEGNEYVYEFSTEVIAYDYETGEDIELEDQPTQGIENTVVYEFDPNAPIYNIQGMQVDRNTRGILIQNGHKFIINGL